MPEFVTSAWLKKMSAADTIREIVISPTESGERFQLVALVGSQRFTLRAANGPSKVPRAFRTLEAAAKCCVTELGIPRAVLRLEGWRPRIENTGRRRAPIGVENFRG